MKNRILTSVTLIILGFILLGINFDFLSKKYTTLLFGLIFIAIFGLFNKRFWFLLLVGNIIISYGIRQITLDYININYNNSLFLFLLGVSFLISSFVSSSISQKNKKLSKNWLFYIAILFFAIATFLVINNLIDINSEMLIKSIFPIIIILVGVIMILRSIVNFKKT
ncbi:hypothetical protein ACAG39_04505 [Caldicellulosiruptoraceae bacterium PP1]